MVWNLIVEIWKKKLPNRKLNNAFLFYVSIVGKFCIWNISSLFYRSLYICCISQKLLTLRIICMSVLSTCLPLKICEKARFEYFHINRRSIKSSFHITTCWPLSFFWLQKRKTSSLHQNFHKIKFIQTMISNHKQYFYISK